MRPVFQGLSGVDAAVPFHRLDSRASYLAAFRVGQIDADYVQVELSSYPTPL